MTTARLFNRFILLAGLAAVLPASADGGPPSAHSDDPDYRAAVAAIEAADFDRAAALLERYTAHRQDDASAWNWLGYASRKRGDLNAAFAHYDKALKLDPDHRGAREYLGEAHLMAGNLAAAEEQLRILDRLCWLPCEEYRDLKKAIAAHKAATR